MKERILDALTDKYGLHMRIKDIATVLKITPGALYNMISAGKCPVPTWRQCQARIASTEKVAEYLSLQEERAEKEFEELKNNLNL